MCALTLLGTCPVCDTEQEVVPTTADEDSIDPNDYVMASPTVGDEDESLCLGVGRVPTLLSGE